MIAFGFLYWELDSGGPGERAQTDVRYPDIAFPQQLNPGVAPPGWRPLFVDYLYLGLTECARVQPHRRDATRDVGEAGHVDRVARVAAILGLVIARAVNILA